MAWDVNNGAQNAPSPQDLYIPVLPVEQQDRLAHSHPPPDGLSPKTTNSKEEGGSHFDGMKIIPDPPNLAHWRNRLFNITNMITMSEEEFQTYFPHIDNVYSHRSTQKYKRKPFVSHYWDCRLKGRPPGTPKSDDPTKKKRKRNTRERDLCDVKIKITEYFASSETQNRESTAGSGAGDGSSLTFIMEHEGNHTPQPFGMLAPTSSLPPGHPGENGARWYTIQRVNGSAGQKYDDADLDHKHSLEDSDKIKKNSVQRWLLKEEKEQKRAQVRYI
jgi:glutathione S-transferase